MTIARSYEQKIGNRPCILLIQVDCLSMAALRSSMETAFGNLRERTPNLHRLWQEGVKFNRYYAAVAEAAPAHAAMVTGLYAYQTFFMHSHKDSGTVRNMRRCPELSSDFPTYGKLLRAAGYDTPLVGSWDAFGSAETFGFSRIDGSAGSSAQAISRYFAGAGRKPFCLSVNVATNKHDMPTSCRDDLTALDRELGDIVSAIPAALSANLITVFTAARGSLPLDGIGQEESLHVPLIVHDRSGRFVIEAGKLRHQLFSSVDLLPMLVSLAHFGSTTWLHESPAWHLLYARRGDLLACLINADAPGRRQVIYTLEKFAPDAAHHTGDSRHVIGVVDGEGSACFSCCWRPGTTELVEPVQPGGTSECQYTAHSEKVLRRLFDEVIPFDLQASMPVALEVSREAARGRLLDYLAQLDMHTARGNS